IRLFPDDIVLSEPDAMEGLPDGIWEWLKKYPESFIIRPGESLPWDRGAVAYRNLVLAPIINRETGEPQGGIAFARRWDRGNVSELLPAVQALSAQIASALHGASIYRDTLDIERFKQDLALAEEIQNSLLPDRAPDIPGWQASASLESAREASGDFFDIIALDDGMYGFAVADVSGKGVSSALYMALVRTLLRTYAPEYGMAPDKVLSAVNRRMLADSRSGLYATLFYGVLDPATGLLTYASAGHNPGFVVRADGLDELGATGIPAGMLPEEIWHVAQVTIAPGQALVLYTDGATDAENRKGDYFGQERLAQTAVSHLGASARELRIAITDEVAAFVDGAPQQDDMTFLIVLREESGRA
ncbi:PP2C family protein-serine/threonine phosphatase, partial [bacterium]|nr:PP2C family protein-serine/threonine phosphatase [bacterium]